MKSKLKPALAGILVLVLVPAVTLWLAPLAKRRAFPHSGEWSGVLPRRDKKRLVARLGFKVDGSCSYHIQGRIAETRYDCQYHMRGDTAVVSTTTSRGNEQYLTVLEAAPRRGGDVVLLPVKMLYRHSPGDPWRTHHFNRKPLLLRRRQPLGGK
jgi:hypothetical protein